MATLESKIPKEDHTVDRPSLPCGSGVCMLARVPVRVILVPLCGRKGAGKRSLSPGVRSYLVP